MLGRESVGVISVVLPTRNNVEYIHMAMSSIVEQAGDWELIAVDDASTDGTGRVLDRFASRRVKVLHNRERHGEWGSVRRGLAHSQGTVIKMVHGDDILLPGAFTKLTHALEGAQAAIASGTASVIDAQGRNVTSLPWGAGIFAIWPAGVLSKYLWRLGNFLGNPPNVLFAREALDTLYAGESSADYVLFLHVAERFPVVTIQDAVVENRLHRRSQTFRLKNAETTLANLQAVMGTFGEVHTLFGQAARRRVVLNAVCHMSERLGQGDDAHALMLARGLSAYVEVGDVAERLERGDCEAALTYLREHPDPAWREAARQRVRALDWETRWDVAREWDLWGTGGRANHAYNAMVDRGLSVNWTRRLPGAEDWRALRSSDDADVVVASDDRFEEFGAWIRSMEVLARDGIEPGRVSRPWEWF